MTNLSPRGRFFLNHFNLYKAIGHNATSAHKLAQYDTCEFFKGLTVVKATSDLQVEYQKDWLEDREGTFR